MPPVLRSDRAPGWVGPLTPYAISVVTTAVATAITAAMWPANRSVLVAMFYLAVIVSAIYGNRLAAILAMALSALSVSYFFLSPSNAFSVTIESAVSLAIFTLVCSVIVALIERVQRTERRERDSEELFGKAFHSNPSGLVISRASDGRYVEMNERFGTIVGRSREEIIGHSAVDLGLVTVEDQAAYIAELRETGGFRERELVISNHPAGERRVLVSSELISFRGLPHFVGIFNDVTERRKAERRLAEQAALLDNAQRIGGMGSWTVDFRTGRLLWSDATCHLFGISPAEFSGTFEQFRSTILPEDLAAYEVASARVSASEPLYEAEYRIRRPDGAVRWMLARGHAQLDANDVVIGRAGVVMDITEQRAGREQLIQNAAMLRTAGRVARLGGWRLDLPDRTLTWSDENCAIHDVAPGYKPSFAEGVGYYPPEYRADVVRHVDACERDGTPYDFELPKYTAIGRRIWVRSIGEAVRDATGKIVALQGAFQDISARRSAEEALREREAEFRTLAESMPQMVWMTRPDGWNTYLNHRWMDYTGLTLEESYGQGWNTPLHPDDRPRTLDAWDHAIARGEYNVECRLRRSDGQYRWMLVRGLPLRDGAGEIVKWIGTCTDIDDLKQAHEATQHAERVQRDLAAQLESERARLVAAQAVASIGSWETDLATQDVIWSAETYRIFERSPEQFHPTHPAFLQCVHPDDRATVDEAFILSLNAHTPGVIEHRVVMPDGRIKYVEERWRVVCDNWGQPHTATGTCQDITERRRAQDAIRMQAHMLDHIGQAVIATDTAGRVTYANLFAGDLYGWGRTDMLGRPLAEVTVPQTTKEQADEILTHLRAGENWSGELMVQDRKGRVFPAHVTDSPVIDESGQLVGIVGISTDISIRQQIEAEMRQKNALIRLAGKVTRTGGWAVEMPGRRITWSDELLDILEYPRDAPPEFEEALSLYIGPWRDTVAAAFALCAEDGTPFDLEVETLTGRGHVKWVRVTAEAERRADGSISRLAGAFQDITERKQLEQQYLRAQRMESIGTLASGIAHDLNNVLAPILLSIGLLQDDEEDVTRLETLATIEASAKRGASMVNRVLSFARGMEGRRVEVQVAPLIRDVATIVRDTFPKNIVFEERLAADLWALRADATQIHQVLLNLCVNARDAMPAGGRLTISARNVVVDEPYAARNIDARLGPHVTIEVEDSGSGIAKDIMDRVFDPFFTTKEMGKGTGLGLPTSLAIVKGHEGFMRVYSEPGSSTRFQLFLPAQTTHAAVAPVAEAVVLPRGNGETVLVVDDEAFIRQIARRTLEAFGYDVLLASDGAEAVAIYERRQAEIDIVLTDMMMPVMNGAATIEELVRLNPDVRIVCASGLATDARTAGAGGARVKHFLAKPYTTETLLRAIRSALP
jgi:PAS domain S-box-containing protein